MFRYKIEFTQDDYLRWPGVAPLNPITVHHDNTRAYAIVKEFLHRSWKSITREPVGALRHPYVVPGAVYDKLWDWDAFFIFCSLPDEGIEYGRGTLLNLLDGIREDGRPPKMASAEGEYLYSIHPYPLHAQSAYVIAHRLNDFSWVAPIWLKMRKVLEWFEKESVRKDVFFTWIHLSGIDNCPSVYGRPYYTCAGIDLASWHYREYKSMEKIACKIGDNSAQVYYREKAESLKLLIQERYWDHVDKFFYSIDCNEYINPESWQKVTWDVHLKFRNFASLFPLWAKCATEEQAHLVIEKIMSEEEFLSPCGVRSHSAIEPLYNNVPTGNPSNWQGPVWGLSTFLTAYGMAEYGYKKEALNVCYRLIRTFAADIEKNGCIHEFYHGDTGQPLINPHFLSWNLLAMRVIDDIENNVCCTTFDMFKDEE